MKAIFERIARFTSSLGIELPILNAPMAGVATPEMVAAVSEAGGLGVLAADLLNGEEIHEAVRQVRSLTKKPFAVNLRIPTKRSEERVDSLLDALSILREEKGLKKRIPLPDFDSQFDALLKEDVRAIRVSFGGLREIYVEKLERRAKEMGKKRPFLIGAATTLREAKVQRAAGVDAVIVQGSEAGGPRLSFEDTDEALLGLVSLVGPAARSTVLPVIASGGITTSAQLAAAMVLGACAVEVGTYLLATKESAMADFYKEAFQFASDTTPRLTRLISGRLTRAIPTEIIRALEDASISPVTYPAQYECMAPIFQAAASEGNGDYADLSCGVSIPRGVPEETSVAIRTLWEDARENYLGEEK